MALTEFSNQRQGNDRLDNIEEALDKIIKILRDIRDKS